MPIGLLQSLSVPLPILLRLSLHVVLDMRHERGSYLQVLRVPLQHHHLRPIMRQRGLLMGRDWLRANRGAGMNPLRAQQKSTWTLVVCVIALCVASADNVSAKIRDAQLGVNAGPVCRVTLPNHRTPPGGRPDPLDYGNGVLWTQVWPYGVVLVRKGDVVGGLIEMKWGWYRGVKGRLHITGSRLDGKAPALKADVTHGYGSIGFQSTVITFPSEGCWKVTGSVAGHSLSLVTVVVRVGR